MLDGDLAQARSSCAKALDKDPGCAVAYFLRARIALREGDRPEVWDRAIRDLQKACIRDPKLTDARELLVRLLIERGQTAEADSALLMLSAARPTDDRLKLAWAELLLATNRQSKLASMLERWHRERPDHPTWLRIRGMLAAQEHRLSEAASAFAQHARQTGDAGSLLGAVAAYVADEQPEEAARLWGELPAEVTGQPAGVMASAYLAPAGDGASVQQRVGKALRDAREPALAQELLEHARQLLAPDQLVGVLADLYAAGPSTIHGLALAECLEASGEAPKAADLLRKLADGAEGRERAELLARVAAAEFASGDLNKAESTLQDALKISPEDPALLNNAAHLALRSGQRDAEAAQLAQRAVAASADDRELQACALGTLGEAYFNLRLYPKSRQALVAALAIRDAADDRYLLGRALMAGGDTVKGVVQLRRAKALAEQDGNTELIRKIAALL
jgi:tetratricopeptide (TPR) repeat protein